jgi:hypothetical protein
MVTSMPALRETIYAEPESNVVGWRAMCGWLERRRADEIDMILAVLAERDAASLTRVKRQQKRQQKPEQKRNGR